MIPVPSSGTPRIRYAHTNLIANDWRKMLAFYVEVFDCVPVSSERDHHGAHIDDLTSLPGTRIRGQHVRLPGHGENGPTLEIFQYERNDPTPPTSLCRPGFAHLAFEVEDVAGKRAEVLARGGRDIGKVVTIDIADAGRLTLNYLSDPEGNIIELQHWHT